MNLVFIGVVAISLIVLLLVVVALRAQMRHVSNHADDDQGLSVQEVNLAVFMDRKAELKALCEAGQLNESDYAGALVELEQEMVAAGVTEANVARVNNRSTRELGLGISFIAIVIAVMIYVGLGDWHADNFHALQVAQVEAGEFDPNSIAEVQQELTWHLRQNPEDLQGHIYLARMLTEQKQMQPARRQYAKALELNPDGVSLMAEYAQFLVNQDGYSPQVVKLLREAKARDPDNTWVLNMWGAYRLSEKDRAGALEHWRREFIVREAEAKQALAKGESPEKINPLWLRLFLQVELDQNGSTFRHRSFLARADETLENYLSWPKRVLAAGLNVQPEMFLPFEAIRAFEMKQYRKALWAFRRVQDRRLSKPQAERIAYMSETIRREGKLPPLLEVGIEVSVAAGQKDKVKAGQTLVLYALDGSGRVGSPLAARRLQTALPGLFYLSEAHAIFPQQTLRTAKRWIVVARLSNTGSEAMQAGDIYGEAQVTEWSNDGKPVMVKISIDKVYQP